MERKVIRSRYPQNTISFYNEENGGIQNDIWSELENGLWKEYNIDNRLYNDGISETNQSRWKPVFNNIYPIYPGFHWDFESNSLMDTYYFPHLMDASKETFMQAAENFFSQFEGHNIGVHLSGGLDSSLIICLLKYFGIPFYLVGFQSKRYEFRTERHIQNLLAPLGEEALLIDIDDYPFYSNLLNTPKHQIPDSYIETNEIDVEIAKAFKRFGVDVVFSGQGGDTILTKDLRDYNGFDGFNIENEFTLPWVQDLLYSPLGINLISFFSDKNIIDQLFSLRLGQNKDILKLWARNYFSDILPKELSEYTYCTDFFGCSLSGLEMAKPDVKELFEESYDLTGHPIFSRKGIDNFLHMDIFSLEYRSYCDLCTKISIAMWLHSLFRED